MIPRRILRLVLGSWRDPLDRTTRQKSQLAALLAWAGLGANGMSAACYGPEKAFLALGGHSELGPLHGVCAAIYTDAAKARSALAHSGLDLRQRQ